MGRNKNELNWPEIIEQYKQSGLTQKSFCKANGLAYSTFKNKIYTQNKSRSIVVPVAIASKDKALAGKPIRISLPNSIEITVPFRALASASKLAVVMEALCDLDAG